MTNSANALATHSKASIALVSTQDTSRLLKADISKKPKTFMQSYREYYQFMLLGRFGDKLPSHSAIVLSRYGLSLALLFERYDSLIHRLQGCNVHQRINYRQQAVNTLPNWPQQSARLNKMWRAWS